MEFFDTEAKRRGVLWEMRALYRREGSSIKKVLQGMPTRSTICVFFTAQQAFEMVIHMAHEIRALVQDYRATDRQIFWLFLLSGEIPWEAKRYDPFKDMEEYFKKWVEHLGFA